MEMLIIFRLESESHYLQHMNHKTFDSSFLKLIKLCLEYAFYFGIILCIKNLKKNIFKI